MPWSSLRMLDFYSISILSYIFDYLPCHSSSSRVNSTTPIQQTRERWHLQVSQCLQMLDFYSTINSCILHIWYLPCHGYLPVESFLSISSLSFWPYFVVARHLESSFNALLIWQPTAIRYLPLSLPLKFDLFSALYSCLFEPWGHRCVEEGRSASAQMTRWWPLQQNNCSHQNSISIRKWIIISSSCKATDAIILFGSLIFLC